MFPELYMRKSKGFHASSILDVVSPSNVMEELESKKKAF